MKVNVSPKGTTTGKSVILGNQTLTDLESNRKSYIIVSTGLKANEEKSYDLRIWMDGATTLEQGLNKNWGGKIVVVSNASEEPAPAPDGWYDAGNETLLAALRKNIEIVNSLTTPGKEPSAYILDNVDSDTFTHYGDTEYYITYGTGWEANETGFNLTGTAVTSDTYNNSYSSLVGKYITTPYLAAAGSKTVGEKVATTNLNSVQYVVNATATSITYK